MPVNFNNANSAWAAVLAETLSRLGLTTAIVCPGSRSTPLTVAVAQHPQIEAIPLLDERSAAFFALGLARRSGRPVALICTSGTAGANFYPAVIEARESRVPLLVLTADRPPELRHCNAGQTIDQQKLFGSFPNWYAELALPALDRSLLAYLRQTLIHSWERSLHPIPGPVHLNLPFRDPLAPIPTAAAAEFAAQFQEEQFFQAVLPFQPGAASLSDPRVEAAIATWQQTERGVIIAGPAQPRSPQAYCAAIAQLSQRLGWVVLAEGLSPLRNYAELNPNLIATYDTLLRQPALAATLMPTQVIRLGEMPTSKELRTWLERGQPQQWVLEGGDRNLDPLHGATTHLQASLDQIVQALPPEPRQTTYSELWCTAEAKLRYRLEQTLSQTETLFEGKAAWLLSRCLPPQTPLIIANSMPVRDVESFWMPNQSRIVPYFNRGANGIDGTLSTALGVAHRSPSSVLLTGDLALLHDTNGFLVGRKFVGHLTIVLINNNGGGIFEHLAIAQFDPPFEDFFATPQSIDFAQLCATYGVAYERITTWEQLETRLTQLPTSGIRVLEIPTDRKLDARWRQQQLPQIAQQALSHLRN